MCDPVRVYDPVRVCDPVRVLYKTKSRPEIQGRLFYTDIAGYLVTTNLVLMDIPSFEYNLKE